MAEDQNEPRIKLPLSLTLFIYRAETANKIPTLCRLLKFVVRARAFSPLLTSSYTLLHKT